MPKDSFIFYRSFLDAIDCMTADVQAEIYPAIVKYALDGEEPQGLSDTARGMFILIKPNIDASVARRENGRKYGKKGGRPAKKTSDAKPEPGRLSLLQEIDGMKADKEWAEPVCAQFHITPEQLHKRLDAFLNHCQCEGAQPHKNITDAKRHLCSWMRKAYPVANDRDDTADTQPPSYEFNGGFGGQDI